MCCEKAHFYIIYCISSLYPSIAIMFPVGSKHSQCYITLYTFVHNIIYQSTTKCWLCSWHMLPIDNMTLTLFVSLGFAYLRAVLLGVTLTSPPLQCQAQVTLKPSRLVVLWQPTPQWAVITLMCMCGRTVCQSLLKSQRLRQQSGFEQQPQGQQRGLSFFFSLKLWKKSVLMC